MAEAYRVLKLACFTRILYPMRDIFANHPSCMHTDQHCGGTFQLLVVHSAYRCISPPGGAFSLVPENGTMADLICTKALSMRTLQLPNTLQCASLSLPVVHLSLADVLSAA